MLHNFRYKRIIMKMFCNCEVAHAGSVFDVIHTTWALLLRCISLQWVIRVVLSRLRSPQYGQMKVDRLGRLLQLNKEAIQ